ncbi:MAG: hypothetical protein R3B90_20340 [Planctomycetaceae bacterium]
MTWKSDSDWDFEPPDEVDDSTGTFACPACGEAVYEEADVCPYCGEYVIAGDSRPGRGGVWAGRPWWWWVALALLCLIAVQVVLPLL